MRWPVFATFAFIAVVVQLSLRNALTLYSVWGISPDFVAALVVFVALFANRLSALWAAWILGVMMDLAPPDQVRGYYVVGVHALGYTAGAYFILQLRAMVFRRRALTLGLLTFLALLATSVVAVMLLSIRSWYPEADAYGPMSDLWRRVVSAVYSGAVAIPLAWILGLSLPLWGFQSGLPRRAY